MIGIHDVGTRGYWDRVNYGTVIPPGQSTLILPVKQLYMGEKARPGRMLNLSSVTKLVFGIDEKPPPRSTWITSAWSVTIRPAKWLSRGSTPSTSG